MLQNRAVSSPLATAAPPNLAGSLERTLANERLQVLKRTFSLPDSLQSFLVFTLLLLLLCGALFAHLLLSTAIHQSELQLVKLRQENQGIVRNSTVLIEQIAEQSSLQRGLERVLAQGYVVAYDRRYLALPAAPQTDVAHIQNQATGEAWSANSATLVMPEPVGR